MALSLSQPALTHLLLARPAAAQTQVVTLAPSIPSNAPEFITESTFRSAVLNSTNFWRAQYSAENVTWNTTLSDYAEKYAGSTACEMRHSGGPDYGENLAMGCGDATGCVDLWGREEDVYDYGSPGFSEQAGHFTQLVWKNTTDIGCGRRLCPGKEGWFLVCEYWPRGNVEGEFAEAVGHNVNSAPAGRPGLCLVVGAGAFAMRAAALLF